MLYIGIDLGTSAVKLVLMDELGKIHRIVSKEYPLSFPKPGWSEQSPEDWYEQTMAGLKELLEGCDKAAVKGMSFGGQMHGLVILDKEDQVIRPAILWNDGRTIKETEELNEVIGKELLVKETGNIAFAGFTAPKLLWMKKEEPELFAKIEKVMLPKDYIAYRMTGVYSTDVSDAAGTLFFDVKNRKWSEKMLEICGISHITMPQIFESYEKTGCLLPEIAAELGLSDTVVVAAGAGDNAAAAVGTGTVGTGACNVSLGTSGTLFLTSDEYCVDAGNALHSFCHADGSFHLMGCMLSAASCNKWWMDGILQTTEYAKEQEGITKLGENEVYFLPYLMGERSPWNDPNARGVFFGMNLGTTREEMTQAVFEGVAFAVRDMLEAARSTGVNPKVTKICGGGAKSPLWRKIIAAVLNMKVEIPESEEGPGAGAAMLAMVASGAYPDVLSVADKIVKVKTTEVPDEELVEKYEKAYQKYRMLYPALKNVFSKE